ncbi:MAG: DUF4252 domain-containing protein [Bacteroidia bacterium]|nr:DUF4252 domain-containing protein [Bacteroidia bacterium]
MKNIRSIPVLLFSLFILAGQLPGQTISPDKMISHIRDKGESIAFTIPGWIVRVAGNIADNDLDENEKEIIQELTNHIKKLRFVVSETIPSDYASKFGNMKNYMEKEQYESLIQVRDGSTDVNIWGQFKGDNIKHLVISVFEDEQTTVLFNIKSDISFNRLKEMEFFQELAEKQGLAPSDQEVY